VRPRCGEVKQAVIDVLRDSEEPLRARQIIDIGSMRFGRALSRNTVDNCLAMGCRGEYPIFERVRPGLFRLSDGHLIM